MNKLVYTFLLTLAVPDVFNLAVPAVFNLAVPDVAFASTASHGEGHVADIYSIKYYIINFAIYAAGILFVAVKFLPGAWSSRRASLTQSIQASRQKINDVEKLYAEAKSKLSKVDSDIKQIQTNISEETKRELEELRIYTESAIQRIEKQVKDTLSVEERSLENAMRKIYTEAALKLAEQKLKSQINAESDKNLRNETRNNMRGLIQ